MSKSFTDWGTELYHYGTRGMKWGSRRYQNDDGSLTALGRERYGVNGNRSARGVKHDLNKMDRERAHAALQANKLSRKIQKAEQKAMIKSKNTGVKVGVNEKTKERKRQLAKYNQLLDKNKQVTDKIIKSARKKGYSVKSRNTMRFVATGKTLAGNIIGAAAAPLTGVGVFRGTSVSGTKYKVKNDGLGMRTHKDRIGYINRNRHRSTRRRIL